MFTLAPSPRRWDISPADRLGIPSRRRCPSDCTMAVQAHLLFGQGAAEEPCTLTAAAAAWRWQDVCEIVANGKHGCIAVGSMVVRGTAWLLYLAGALCTAVATVFDEAVCISNSSLDIRRVESTGGEVSVASTLGTVDVVAIPESCVQLESLISTLNSVVNASKDSWEECDYCSSPTGSEATWSMTESRGPSNPPRGSPHEFARTVRANLPSRCTLYQYHTNQL